MTNTKHFYYDVLVVGGGVAGVFAAISAARRGCRTIIIESTTSMGGLATNGYVTGVAGMNDGMCKEWLDRLDEVGALFHHPHLPSYEPEKAKLMLEHMLVEAGVRILYGTCAIDVTMDGSTIKSVCCHGKSGQFEIEASIYIDGTGDGDLAAYAGAPYEVGSPHFAGLNMSTTLAFRMANVNLNEYYAANNQWRDELGRTEVSDRFSLYCDLQDQAVAEGELPFRVFPMALIYPVPGTPLDDADIAVMTTHSMFTRNLDTEDLTRQIMEQHCQIEWMERFFRARVPGFQRARLTSIANLHGVRDSRRIIGMYILRDSDVAAGRKFEDGIARFPEFFDTHHPTSRQKGFLRHVHLEAQEGSAVVREAECDYDMHPFGRPAGKYEARPDPKDYCEIPYRALVPLRVDNLLVVGRCVSAEFNAQAAVRVIAPSIATGQAAGIAASLCLKEGTSPRELDGKRIRAIMIEEDGVPLDQEPGGHWERVRGFQGNHVVLAGDFIGYQTEDGIVHTPF